MRLDRLDLWWRSRDRWVRLAILLWGAVLLALLVRLLLASRYAGVYPIFAGAAHSWLAGTETYLAHNNQDVYRYSPLITALLSPLGLLPDRLGSLLWRGVNVAAYLGGLAWWMRVVLPASLSASRRAWLVLLLLPLSVGNLHNGQSNPLILGLLLAAQAALAEERWNGAAAFAALAAWLKVYPLAVGLLLAAVYPRRFAGRLLVAVLVGFALPFLLQQPDYVAGQYASWLNRLLADDRQAESVAYWYRDLRLLWAVWLGPLPDRAYAVIQLGTAGLFAGLCIIGRLRQWSNDRLLPLLLALSCCWMTVFGPASESSTYILLAPSIAWVLLREWQPGGGTIPRLLVTASYVLLVSTQLAAWFPQGRAFHTLGPHPLAALLFLAGLLLSEWRMERRALRPILGSCLPSFMELTPSPR